MGSSSDEDVQVLLDPSEDENTETTDSEVGKGKGKKENTRIADVPFDIDEGELLDVCSIYDIAPEHKLVRPSEYMRVNELLDSESIILYEESF
ncbi:hypothetical protein JCGZ_27094 [Jatropha curcas]|uniref:Uncharacterized protein n=1 Tax=Jatropha curcas TaxID=180498 RepID=A0A067JWK4_JATCU|nr:hypothetical protein JCGZ_27094 [Jatropha curcas]